MPQWHFSLLNSCHTIVQGVAMAFFSMPQVIITPTLSGIEPEYIPAVLGLSKFMRILTNPFGTSIARGARSFYPVLLKELNLCSDVTH